MVNVTTPRDTPLVAVHRFGERRSPFAIDSKHLWPCLSYITEKSWLALDIGDVALGRHIFRVDLRFVRALPAGTTVGIEWCEYQSRP